MFHKISKKKSKILNFFDLGTGMIWTRVKKMLCPDPDLNYFIRNRNNGAKNCYTQKNFTKTKMQVRVFQNNLQRKYGTHVRKGLRLEKPNL